MNINDKEYLIAKNAQNIDIMKASTIEDHSEEVAIEQWVERVKVLKQCNKEVIDEFPIIAHSAKKAQSIFDRYFGERPDVNRLEIFDLLALIPEQRYFLDENIGGKKRNLAEYDPCAYMIVVNVELMMKSYDGYKTHFGKKGYKPRQQKEYAEGFIIGVLLHEYLHHRTSKEWIGCDGEHEGRSGIDECPFRDDNEGAYGEGLNLLNEMITDHVTLEAIKSTKSQYAVMFPSYFHNEVVPILNRLEELTSRHGGLKKIYLDGDLELLKDLITRDGTDAQKDSEFKDLLNTITKIHKTHFFNRTIKLARKAVEQLN